MPRLTEGGYDAGNDSDPVRGACNRPVHTHLYVLSLQKHEETGLSLCPVASVCADRVRLSNAVPAWQTVPVDILRDRISVCASVCVRTGPLYSRSGRYFVRYDADAGGDKHLGRDCSFTASRCRHCRRCADAHRPVRKETHGNRRCGHQAVHGCCTSARIL